MATTLKPAWSTFRDKQAMEKAIKQPSSPVRQGVLSNDGKTIIWNDGKIELVNDTSKNMKLTLKGEK